MSAIKRFLDALLDLERSTGILDERVKQWREPASVTSILTAQVVNGTLTIEPTSKDNDLKETDKQKDERRKANEAVLRSYGLLKPPKPKEIPVVKPIPDYVLIYYVDFQTKACTAKYKEPKTWRPFGY